MDGNFTPQLILTQWSRYVYILLCILWVLSFILLS